jgi:hypothetical protein
MYEICPKCHYPRQDDDTGSHDICPACGLVFSKWIKYQTEINDNESVSGGVAEMSSIELEQHANRVVAREAEATIDPMVLWGRVAVYLLLFIWGWYFILLEMESNAIGYSFLHNVDLVFHEAGHVFFRPLGDFMMVLGGSLMQIIMPLVVMFVFLFKQHDIFGASVGLWWTGQSLMDIAPYINDARAMELQLVGGGTGRDRPGIHDWNNLLWDLGMLPQDHAIASTVDTLGEIVVLLALAWGGYVLFRQFQPR